MNKNRKNSVEPVYRFIDYKGKSIRVRFIKDEGDWGWMVARIKDGYRFYIDSNKLTLENK